MPRFSDITILLDRSGSMASSKETTVKGINDFIRKVNSDPGEGYWTLLTFDDPSSAEGAREQFPQVVFSHLREHEVPLLELEQYRPRGGTALADAVCRTVLEIQNWWKKLSVDDQQDKPKVLLVIMTDGQENSSREYTSERMRTILAEFQNTCGAEILYLGANQDAFHEAAKYGIQVTSQPWLQNAQAQGAMPLGSSNVLQVSPQELSTGVYLSSGAVCARSWKADGNMTAEQFLSSAAPDLPPSQNQK